MQLRLDLGLQTKYSEIST